MSISFDEIYLTSTQILDRISEKEIYEYYLGEKVDNKLVNCCFHKDSTPSLGFVSLDNNLIFRCFGCGAKGNVFNFVQRLNNCNYGKAHRIIQDIFKLSKNQGYVNINNNSISSRTIIDSSKFGQVNKLQIIPTYRNWNKIDFDYWSRYYIPFSLLDEYNIKPCTRVYVVNRTGDYILFAEHFKNNPIYAYHIANSIKIYRPLNPNKKGKWASNCDSFDIQGLEQLPDKGELLIITSSMKDVLVLNVMGYNAIALGGEGNKIPDAILDYLWACFDNIIVFYDNDKAGLEYGNTLANDIGAGNIHIPIEIKDKDISDYVDTTSLEDGIKLMKQLL